MVSGAIIYWIYIIKQKVRLVKSDSLMNELMIRLTNYFFKSLKHILQLCELK